MRKKGRRSVGFHFRCGNIEWFPLAVSCAYAHARMHTVFHVRTMIRPQWRYIRTIACWFCNNTSGIFFGKNTRSVGQLSHTTARSIETFYRKDGGLQYPLLRFVTQTLAREVFFSPRLCRDHLSNKVRTPSKTHKTLLLLIREQDSDLYRNLDLT